MSLHNLNEQERKVSDFLVHILESMCIAEGNNNQVDSTDVISFINAESRIFPITTRT